LDGAAVALTTEMAMAAKAKALTAGSGAAWVRATKRSVAHEILLSEAWSGPGPTTRTEAYALGFRRIDRICATATGARLGSGAQGIEPPDGFGDGTATRIVRALALGPHVGS